MEQNKHFQALCIPHSVSIFDLEAFVGMNEFTLLMVHEGTSLSELGQQMSANGTCATLQTN
jgi:hypothetical protein